MPDGVIVEMGEAPGMDACRIGWGAGPIRFSQHKGRYRDGFRVVLRPVGVNIYVRIVLHLFVALRNLLILSETKLQKHFNMADFSVDEIRGMLECEGKARQELFDRALRIRNETVGEGIYLRGLIELSNVCRKNCLYCGIRRENPRVERYTLTDDQVLEAARYAWQQGYGSVVLQAGERVSEEYVARIERLVRAIRELSGGALGITLSLGEQTPDTYRRWREAGAHRYLLRIESSSPELYRRIHPDDSLHQYEDRVRALEVLAECGYQVGTGVMIGLPGQTTSDLARDILFMKSLDIDMCGMGPYIESEGTPLAEFSYRQGGGIQKVLRRRLELTLKMIATLRIVMPDINIAATTALQVIDPMGRLQAVECGANVVMPNLSPQEVRANYALYDNKPFVLDSRILERHVQYGQRGDSLHFKKKRKKQAE